MYSLRRDAIIKTSRGSELGAGGAEPGERTIERFGSLLAADALGAGEEPLSAGFIGAFSSIAAASLWRALGRWTSKHDTEQKTYPVRWPLQVETLQV